MCFGFILQIGADVYLTLPLDYLEFDHTFLSIVWGATMKSRLLSIFFLGVFVYFFMYHFIAYKHRKIKAWMKPQQLENVDNPA